MTATVETLTAEIADLQVALEKARKAKKAQAPIKAQIKVKEAELAEAVAQTVAEAEKITADAVKRPVGRPRTKAPEFYELRDALRRPQRGRPSREVVINTLRELGVGDELDHLKSRELEVMLKTVRAVALANAAKGQVA